MRLRYLLDTSTFSHPMNSRADSRVAHRIEAHAGELATAAPAWHEARFGAERLPPSRRRDALLDYLQRSVAGVMPVLPYDEAAAGWHASERVRVGALGRVLPFVDGQIAAVARVNGLVLVTANVRDFEGLEGLAVENWLGG